MALSSIRRLVTAIGSCRKKAHELAARAFVTKGDYAGGLYWAQRSLRLMPENPLLLVMVADVAAKRGQPVLADASARDALRYLADADTPDPLSPSDWPRVRNELRSTANLALAQVAASRRGLPRSRQAAGRRTGPEPGQHRRV